MHFVMAISALAKRNLQKKKENIMRNLIKLVTVCSFLLVASFLISACGSGDTENFVQGNGQIDVTVKDTGGAFLSNIRIDVKNSGGTTIGTSTTTTATTTTIFQETVGSDYTFTFTDLNIPVRFTTTPTITVTPLLTATVHVDAQLLP